MRMNRRQGQLVAVAVATVAFGGVILWRQWGAMSPMAILEALVGLGFMATVTWTDMRSKRIPNWLVLAMLCSWAVLQMVTVATGDTNLAFAGLMEALLGGGFCLFVFFVAYLASRRQLGGGDVKLSAVMGLYLTNMRVLGAVLYGLVLCALYSLIMIMLKKIDKKDSIPLAPFLALGYAISFLFIF